MRKHFLLLFLMALLPLAGFAEDVTLLTGATLAKDYNGVAPTITVKESTEGSEGLTGTWTTTDGVLTEAGLPTAAAGTYKWTETVTSGTPRTATYVISKVQIVYYLTGATYSVGDKPDVTRSYSLASGSSFIGGDKLEDFATFDFATSGNDALDLDENKRFTTIKTYNIKALRVIEKPGVHQNYDFRFTSTAVIVVTAKSIAGFLADAVADQTYTGSQITFDANALPKIYATAADRDAAEPIALDPSNYEVSYGDNLNVVYDGEHHVVNGGTIIYKGKGNYEGTLPIPFKIQPRELTRVTVEELADRTYARGTSIEPNLTGMVKGTGAELNKEYTLDPTKDFTVNYNGSNINAGNAVGTISVANGNFTFATNAEIDDVEFTIDPKDLSDNDIEVTVANAPNSQTNSYPYTGAQIQPNFTVTWTIDETENVITDNTAADWTENTNIAVGKGYVTVVPKANAVPQNYKGSKTVAFDIIPTDLVSAGVTITLQKKDPNYVPTQEQPESWIDATYQYEGREIKPGTPIDNELVDGRLLVKKGTTVLVEGVDYEIVANKYGADVTVDHVNYTGNNKKASVIANTKGTVTIKGLGNYGAIDALSEPITLSQVFNIAKRKLTFTAKAVTTTFGVAPTFDYDDNIVEGENLGGHFIDPNVDVATYSGTAWGDFADYEGLLNALEVTPAVENLVAGSKKYQYTPSWDVYNTDALTPDQIAEKEAAQQPYDTKEQIDARLNYDLVNIEYVPGAITVNNATWIIVPEAVSKKYMVADKALAAANKFTYKVYNGTKAPENLVAIPSFDPDCAPVIGRADDARGENVKDGPFVISVLNANGNVEAGDYGSAQHKVAKTGYTIVCETATLTIEPFPITITANNQTILYGGEPNTEVTAESMIQTVDGDGNQVAGTIQTVTFTPVMFGNQTLINRNDLNLKLTWDGDGTVSDKPHADALVPTIDNPNFVVTKTVKGSVTVIAGNNIDVVRLDANEYAEATTISNTIQNFNGKTAGFTLKATSANDVFKTIHANRWYALVLPFNTSVREVSKAFGYAVVDKFNTESSNTKDVSFKLHVGDITANEPFIFKVDKDIDLIDHPVTFTGHEIVYDEDPSVSAADGKVKFIGVYDGKKDFKGHEYIFSLKNGNISGTTATSYIPPMSAYIHMEDQMDGMTNAPVFNIEEPDGSTTSISAVDFATNGSVMSNEGWYTVNGIKLTAAPTEKGVYVNNGKKVVIK